jgi:hypothetical protein
MLFTFEVAFSVPIEINIDAYFVAFLFHGRLVLQVRRT